jgi:hypothetical protein
MAKCGVFGCPHMGFASVKCPQCPQQLLRTAAVKLPEDGELMWGKCGVFIHIVQHLIIAYSSTFNGELKFNKFNILYVVKLLEHS